MQLIVGHTTDQSARIWVRGDPRNPRLTVEIEALGCAEGCADKFTKEIEVGPKGDYTGVADFDELEADKPYVVRVSSAMTRDRLEGRLQTFSAQGAAAPLRFLHGSCNLPTARLAALGSMAVALLGSAATENALDLPWSEWERHRIPRCLERLLSRPAVRDRLLRPLRWASRLPRLVVGLTRFAQPMRQRLPSPFKQILACVTGEDQAARPAFMIHCGDQIYFDVDYPNRRGEQEDYWRNYRQAWFEDEDTAEVLRSLPHYMILDDHEIVDGFGTYPSCKSKRLREPALAAYHHYVASRQPPHGEGLHYSFEHGNTGFFVLDTRTERSAAAGEMIGDKQLEALDAWLSRSFDVRFIVSSVPFIAELRPPGLDAKGERHGDERADKWSGPLWRSQRERIIAMIYEHEVERLVFLVGDMHCTYHVRMQIGDPLQRFTVHELAGGPLNQISFATRDQFYERYSSTFKTVVIENGKTKEVCLPWTCTLEAFHGSAASVLDVSVVPGSKEAPPEVNWKALRTHPAPRTRSVSSNVPRPDDPHELCGRILFHRPPLRPK